MGQNLAGLDPNSSAFNALPPNFIEVIVENIYI